MKNFLIHWLLLLMPVCSMAQFVLTGKVMDARDGVPVQEANVKVAGGLKGTITNFDGTFTLKFEEVKDITLEISHVGYETHLAKVNIQGNNTFEEFFLEPVQRMEEVVISAVRAGENIPVTQKTIDKQTLEAGYIGQDPVFALEKLSPSILAYSESGTNLANYSQIRLRGIDQTRINITLNGIPLNDMIDQGVFFSNFTDFGNSIESLQIQRGVGTSTNGTASYAGSVNFESVRLNEPGPNAEVQLLGGSFNTYRGSAEVNTGLMNNKMAFYSRFTKTISDGYKFHSGTNSNSFFFSGGYFGEQDLVKLTGFIGRTRNELAYLPVLIDDILAEPRTNYLSENDKDDFGQQFVQLQHTRWFQNNIYLTSSLYYGGAGGDFPFGFTDGEGNFVQQNFPLYNDHYGLMSSLNINLNKLELSGGLHVYTFKRKNEESIIPDKANPYYRDKSQKDEASFFAKGSYHFDKLSIYGDIQIRSVWLGLMTDLEFLEGQGVNTENLSVPTRQWTFVNPKAGITYSLNHKTNIYASFGRGGREPTRFDILGSTNINAFNLNSVLNENAVKAEYVNDFELGSRLSSGNFQGQANFFYMDFNNEIAPIGEFIPEGFVQLRKNIKDSYRTGIETDWSWKPWDALTFAGNATFMKSRIKEFSPDGTTDVVRDVNPILSPKWLINNTLTYHHQQVFELSFTGRYVSGAFLELTNQDELTIPSFFVADAQLKVNFLKDHSFTLQVNNLFDKLYFTNGSPVDVDFDGTIDGPGYLVQPPRHFYALVRLRF